MKSPVPVVMSYIGISNPSGSTDVIRRQAGELHRAARDRALVPYRRVDGVLELQTLGAAAQQPAATRHLERGWNPSWRRQSAARRSTAGSELAIRTASPLRAVGIEHACQEPLAPLLPGVPRPGEHMAQRLCRGSAPPAPRDSPRRPPRSSTARARPGTGPRAPAPPGPRASGGRGGRPHGRPRTGSRAGSRRPRPGPRRNCPTPPSRSPIASTRRADGRRRDDPAAVATAGGGEPGARPSDCPTRAAARSRGRPAGGHAVLGGHVPPPVPREEPVVAAGDDPRPVLERDPVSAPARLPVRLAPGGSTVAHPYAVP